MRIWFYLILLGWSSLIFATDVTIKTTTADKKTVYQLHVGTFLNKENAEQLKKKLFTIIKEPINIEYLEDKKLYLLKIGPIHNLPASQALKKKITATLNDPSFNASTKSESSDTIWNLKNADIRAVIAEVSRVTGKNFIIDPRVQGKVSIVSSTSMNNKELYQVFLSILQVSGYAAIPTGDVIKIIPNIEAKTQAPDLLSTMRNPPRGDDILVQVVPIKYVPAEQLVPVLRPLMPQWSSISAYGPSNMLILSGRANNIKQMADIIKQVDSSNSSGIDIVPLKYALAMDITSTLKDLIKTSPGNRHIQTTIAADDRNNSVLISGNKTERIRLRLLISKLDSPGPYGKNSNTQVVYLSYSRAEDLAPILAGIAQASFSGTVGTTIGTVTRPPLDSTNPAASMAQSTSSGSKSKNTETSTKETLPNTSAADTHSEGSTKPSVQIIAEPNTNSIIINGPPTLIRSLKSVISQLDIKPAQILVEALVAEVNESDVNSLGVELGTAGVRQRNLNLNLKNSFRERRAFQPGFAILDSDFSLDDFQARIYALARDKKANILSTPSVIVLDNRQAKILIGKQISVATTSYPNNAEGTTTASPYTTFERVNVALHLYVRPQITREGGIQMQIDQGNDSLDPVSALESTTNPVFNVSAIVTSVHVDSGDIIVLGGLIQDSIGNDDNRIPVLGDIPGIGRLFQHNIKSREKKVLMVFIKPLILRSKQDSFQVSGAKYNDVRQLQLEMLRSQEYHEKGMDTVMPPLRNAELPKPFCKPPLEKAGKLPIKQHFATK